LPFCKLSQARSCQWGGSFQTSLEGIRRSTAVTQAPGERAPAHCDHAITASNLESLERRRDGGVTASDGASLAEHCSRQVCRRHGGLSEASRTRWPRGIRVLLRTHCMFAQASNTAGYLQRGDVSCGLARSNIHSSGYIWN
jgi:hypothetical protein